MKRVTPFFVLLFLLIQMTPSGKAHGAEQDTLIVSFPEFLEMAIDASKQLQSRRQQVNAAETRKSEAQASRFLPNANVTTAHGLIPGVKGAAPGTPNSEFYLDPNLRNDWEDWGFFNQLEATALQPIYTWGAIGNAIKAARAGVQVEEFGYRTERSNYEMQMYQLYQSRLLAMELGRIADEAARTLRQAERELNKMLDEGDTDLEDADLYQFEIFKHRFQSQLDEIRENDAFIDRAWRLALGIRNQDIVILPDVNFLDPVEPESEELTFYEQQAISGRPELRQISAARDAAQYGLEAVKAQNYPSIFLGINARYAYAPNRPRQRNPFISNPTNTSSLTVGLGLRQNLNFFILRSRTERSRYQLRQVEYASEAVADGIQLDVSDKYKDFMVAQSRLQNTGRALNVSREWLRQEQLDYDIGFGDVLNLVDAVKENLELEAEHIQRIHNFNVNTARLYKASGIPLITLFELNQQ